MKQEAALRVLAEASADKRITAEMRRAKEARNPADGYQVRLVLRNGLRLLTVHNLEEWHDIRFAWSEL